MEQEQLQQESQEQPTANMSIDLFGEQLPSIEDIRKLCNQVHSTNINLHHFTEQVEQNLSKTGHQGVLACGIGLHLLGRDAEAIDKLKKANGCKEKSLYLAYCQRRMGDFKVAISNFDKAAGKGVDNLMITLSKVSVYRRAGDFKAAQEQLDNCANFKNVSADYHYQLARLLEAQGLYYEAKQNYKTAIELSPEHSHALFHLAYRCDLDGHEDEAIDYYKQATRRSPVHVSALLNLAVLYEDAEKYDKASKCVEEVLRCHPNHKKAILFLKDIESSKTMIYDEEKEMKKTRKAKILETPISDFELSVRSRNCLKKMKIHTLGDLLKISEAELLSYKNFGETSLREIKAILDPRSLNLGMELEDAALASVEAIGFATTEMEDQGLLSKPVEDLQLSVRAKNALHNLNLRTLGDLTRKTDAELLGCKNFGVTSLNEIRKALSGMGLALRTLD